MLLYGCESWCLTAESISRLRNWHNKRIREMCRVTMWFVHQISSASLQKRTGVFPIEYYLASRTLLWAGHVARMPKSRLPKRLMLSLVHEPRIEGGQGMTYGRSLERHLKHFGLDDGGKAITFSEWATLAQDWLAGHSGATLGLRLGRSGGSWRGASKRRSNGAPSSTQKQTQKGLKAGPKFIP